MQTEPITYAADPRIVAETITGQRKALLDTIRRLPPDYTTLSNTQWLEVFSLYWGVRELMGIERWRQLWATIKRYRQQPRAEPCGWDLWCWLEDARDWRREQARTQSGRGKRRWKTLQKSPKKHAAHKQRNREAQRRRRARLSTPEHAE